MTKTPTASLRARWLGEWLRDARTKAGYKLTEAGEYLQMDHTTLSRFERGTHRIRRSYIKDLIDFYGIADKRVREALLKLNEDSWKRDWWEGDSSDLDASFIDYTWLEARAKRMKLYTPMLIPGLFQTQAYAEAIMANNIRPDEQRIARLVELRMARQRILDGDDPTGLSVVIEETPLRRPVGGSQILKTQLQSLLDTSTLAHVEVQVLPTSVGWHAGEHGPFTCFEMHDPFPDVAFVENLGGRIFFENEAKVANFVQAYDDLKRTALNPRESIKFIERVMRDIS